MARLTTPSSTATTDADWMSGLRTGHQVDLLIYGERMTGRVLRINPDNFTVRIPVEQQTVDVRRFSVTGTAVVSLDASAANVPVTVQATGELVRVQVIGPAQIIQRRRHQRVRVAVPVEVTWRVATGWSQARTTTQDLSTGGLRLAPARTVWPSAGDEVVLALEVPGGQICKEKATVIGKTPEYGLRVEFVRLSERCRQWIAELVEEHGD